MAAMGRKLTIGWVPVLLWVLGGITVLHGLLRFWIMGEALATGAPLADPVGIVYVQHPWLAVSHILPGIVFMLVGPLQFIPSIRRHWPKTHRVLGRVFIISGVLAAVTALGVEFVFPLRGGYAKRAAMVLFACALIVALVLAWRAAVQRRIDVHRAWVIRGYAIGLALSTTRLYFLPYFVLFGHPGTLAAGLVTWTGFCVNVVAAEWIIHRLRRAGQAKPPALEAGTA